jgi:membrane protease YdiL (CAAX protease family)
MWLPALLVPVVLRSAGLAAAGGPIESLPAGTLLVSFFGLFVWRFLYGAGLGEELGWRGFLLPMLQDRMSPLAASLLVGAVWAGWHAPQFVIPAVWGPRTAWTGAFLYVGMAPALSILFAWLYNRGDGSVLLAAVAHGLFNAGGGFLERLAPAADRSFADEWVTLAAAWAAAGIVLAFEGRALGARRPSRLAE